MVYLTLTFKKAIWNTPIEYKDLSNAKEIAIDLGTANTLIIHNDKVVINSPSIVAMDRTTKKIIAIGEEAKFMQGKTHENIKTIRPLKDGVIADFEASEKMISELIRSIPTLKKRWFSPSLTMVICIPSGITEVEKTYFWLTCNIFPFCYLSTAQPVLTAHI